MNYELTSTLAFRIDDDSREDCDKFLRFREQGLQLRHFDDSRFAHEMQPITALPGFFLRDAQFMDEVGTALARLSLFNIGANGSCTAQILFGEDPSGAILVCLQEAIELNRAQGVSHRPRANIPRFLFFRVHPFPCWP